MLGISVDHAVALAIGAGLVAAGAMFVGRRRRENDRTGSQGGVILLLVGAMAIIFGLGLLEYRPGGSF